MLKARFLLLEPKQRATDGSKNGQFAPRLLWIKTMASGRVTLVGMRGLEIRTSPIISSVANALPLLSPLHSPLLTVLPPHDSFHSKIFYQPCNQVLEKLRGLTSILMWCGGGEKKRSMRRVLSWEQYCP